MALEFTHAQLTGLCGVVLAVVGVRALLWTLQVISGVRVLRTSSKHGKFET